MRILMALSRFPYPLDKGDKLRAFHQLKYLGQKHELHLVCISEESVSDADRKEVEKKCKSLKVVALSAWQSRSNVAKAAISKLPYQVAYFKSAEAKKQIEQCIKENRIEVCYFQLIRMGENIPFEMDCSFYLDYMDAFSTNMTRRLPFYSGIKKSIFSTEAERVKRYELGLLKKVSGSCFIAAADATVLNSDAVDIIPNGVDDSFFEEAYENRRFDYDLIFTGNMSYHPNVQAALFLVNELLPQLNSADWSPKVCIAGTSPSSEVLALQSDQVEVTGRVPDLKPYLRKSKYFVAPLFSGSGLQNKLLESMAMSLPTLSTPLANQALKASNNEMLQCKDVQAFVDAIDSLRKNEAQTLSLSQKGHDYVLKNYRWEHFNQLLENRLLNLALQS